MLIGTLGPKNTNSELASYHYLEAHRMDGAVELYATPERSIEALINKEVDKTILCIVYPKLNDLVFENLADIEIKDVFTCATDEMVIGQAREGDRACCHPAPVNLIQSEYDNISYVSSNSEAARLCVAGDYDVCVTTRRAAEEHGLRIKRNFGKVSMGWAVFERKH